jgi:L-alanine-DL-glutamate epimerase-like enolase superfamily enzyme
MMEAPWVNGNPSTEVVGPYPEVKDGYALPLEAPGLGVTVNEEAAAGIPFTTPPMQPRLNGIDGSVRDF